MEFIVRGVKRQTRYKQADYDKAKAFSDILRKEMKDFISGVILFGSKARGQDDAKADLDIMVVINDVSKEATEEVLRAYNLITKKAAEKTDPKIHLTTVKLSVLWEYMRNADPVFVTMLRDGTPIYDTGFFEPMQVLLEQGRIPATKESINTYTLRAPATLHRAQWHILQAAVDLYWAVLDAAHAALMAINEIPPNPAHVPKMVEEKLINTQLIETQYLHTLKQFFHLYDHIQNKRIKELSAVKYEHYYAHARHFIDRMHRFITKEVQH